MENMLEYAFVKRGSTWLNEGSPEEFVRNALFQMKSIRKELDDVSLSYKKRKASSVQASLFKPKPQGMLLPNWSLEPPDPDTSHRIFNFF